MLLLKNPQTSGIELATSVRVQDEIKNKTRSVEAGFIFVPGIGIEPIHPCECQILSLLRLPVPPPGRWYSPKTGCNVTYSVYSIQNEQELSEINADNDLIEPGLNWSYLQQLFFGRKMLPNMFSIFFSMLQVTKFPADTLPF